QKFSTDSQSLLLVDGVTLDAAPPTRPPIATSYWSGPLTILSRDAAPPGRPPVATLETPPTAAPAVVGNKPISLAKLDTMIGLGAVKSKIFTLAALAEAERKRRDAGMPATDLM